MSSVFHLELLGNTVWSGSWDGTIRVFNSRSHALLGKLRPYHTDAITSMVPIWNKARSIWQLWTSSFDGAVCVWKLNSISGTIGLAPPVATAAASPVKLQRRPSIMVQPVVVDTREAGLVLQTRKHRRPHLTIQEIEMLAASETLPGHWKETKRHRRRVTRENSVTELIAAAQRHTRVACDPVALEKWFSEKGITQCGHLMDAPDNIWEELKTVADKRVCSAMRHVLRISRTMHHCSQSSEPPSPSPRSSSEPRTALLVRTVRVGNLALSPLGDSFRSLRRPSDPPPPKKDVTDRTF